MTLNEIASAVDARIIAGDVTDDVDIAYACASDVMCDLLSLTRSDTILLTGIDDSHMLRAAEELSVRAVLYVRGIVPSRQTIEAAEEHGTVLLSTDRTMFTTCGMLYERGIRGMRGE